MSCADMLRCDRCHAVFEARRAAQDRYRDPLCPDCGSKRLSHLLSRGQRVHAAVDNSNRY